MICAWEALISILPVWMREFVDKQGRLELQELRLRVNKPPLLVSKSGNLTMNRSVTREDLNFCINLATKYSPWSVTTGQYGYYTAPGGHRIGVCGTVVPSEGQAGIIKNITSLCIRVSRDFPGIAQDTPKLSGSLLIIGSPGCGKTTLLRDLVRQLSGKKCVTVVDERQEIFPQFNDEFCFDIGLNTDILYGCDKEYGIYTALRNMGPEVIVVDEITKQEDCDALLRAAWCGVDLVATAHAGSKKDLLTRTVYKPIVEADLFRHMIIMRPDKSWYLERI